ncbi:glycoprotease family protein, partial [Emiliania huxleyi CCMP1516]|uniref:N(6)-L-threonylcarbamoyladenine synthase n=2 Tax=Emiliania huxleyi TaxID=2903 RepID=A0A0D3I8Y0_EMIH1
TVLGIETSCDDTGVAVVRSDGEILGEAIASQAELHEAWGGVVPGIARDAHRDALGGAVELALRRAGLSSAAEVDAVAVTVGPGLEICLRVGCEEAVRLATAHGKAFVAVHHLEAHVLMARLACHPPPPFPFLTLLTSGGHCQLLLTRGIGDHQVIGSTLDDALGEAYDKVARLLELPVGGGGGPALESLAREGDPSATPLPVPMRNKPSFDFSLKTAVRLAVERASEEERASPAFRAGVAASFQNAALRHLEMRLTRARDSLGCAPDTLVLSGGVAANAELRRRTPSPRDDGAPWRMVVPPPRLCTDNGVMVAWAAAERLKLGLTDAPDV